MLYRGRQALISECSAGWSWSLHNWRSEFWNSWKVRNIGSRNEEQTWRTRGLKKKRVGFTPSGRVSWLKPKRREPKDWCNLSTFQLDDNKTVDSILWIGDFIFFWDTCLLVVYIKYLKIGSVKGLHKCTAAVCTESMTNTSRGWKVLLFSVALDTHLLSDPDHISPLLGRGPLRRSPVGFPGWLARALCWETSPRDEVKGKVKRVRLGSGRHCLAQHPARLSCLKRSVEKRGKRER